MGCLIVLFNKINMKIKLTLLACIIGLLSCSHQKGVVNDAVDSTKDKVNKTALAIDTICAIHKISWSKSLDLKNNFNDISNTYLYGNNLFILSALDTTLLIMNTVTGEVNKPVALNKSLRLLFPLVKYPSEVYASKDGIFVGFAYGVAKFDYKYNLIFKITLKQQLKHFTVFSDSKIVLFYEDGPVSLFNNPGRIDSINTKTNLDLVGYSFNKSYNGFYFDGLDSVFTINILKKDSIVKKFESEVPGTSIFKPFKGYFTGFIGDKYIYWFPYQKRNCLIITDIKVTKIIKTIPFKGFDWSVTNEEENDEMDQNRHPEFYIDVDDNNNFYITNYKNGTLSVFKGCLGLK